MSLWGTGFIGCKMGGLDGPISPVVAKKKKTKSRGQGRLKLSRVIDTRVIYCGDNLEYLKTLPDACVDLVYIDPPFNSNRNYEVFWGERGESRAFEDRHESVHAYRDFMRPRCAELVRILKPTGSFYYHCDWHASHYIKVMLDEMFGIANFRNEIVWRRTKAHNDGRKYGNVHDTLFFYTASKKYTWNPQYTAYSEDYLSSEWRELPSGRYYKTENMLDPRGSMKEFDFKGKTARWRTNREGMQQLWDAPQTEVPDSHGRIKLGKDGTPIKRCRIVFLDERDGVPLQTWWDDIPGLSGGHRERVGYPTQKPLPLLERIIKSSSNEGDVVLDAFCGCGTTIEAAESLNRQWVGIDVSPTACKVMSKRLRDRCNIKEDEGLWLADRAFVVKNLPWTEDRLREIPPSQFEDWAVIALNGQPNARKVGDGGIDGRIYPASDMKQLGASGEQLEFTLDMFFPVQVKQKQVGRPDIQNFRAVMEEHDSRKGYVVGFGFSKPAEVYARKYAKDSGRELNLVTVSELLDSAEQQRYA